MPVKKMRNENEPIWRVEVPHQMEMSGEPYSSALVKEVVRP